MKNIWKQHKRKIILGSVLLILFIGLRYAYVRLPIITGYAAKDMCSCVFIGQRNHEDVANNEFQFSLIKYASYEVDEKNQSVTASIMGLGSKTAYYSPNNGCVILNDIEKEKWQQLEFNKTEVQNKPLIDDRISYENNKELQAAIDNHFKDDDPEKPFGTRAVVILKEGKLIAEQYAKGFDKNSKHIGWSMTKSIFNALIGIAIQEKLIVGIDEKKLFEEWSDERKEISLKNILQMNSGLNWEENYGSVSEATVMLYDRDNMIDFAIEQPLEGTIGSHWEYSSGSSNLLSGILRRRLKDEEYFDFPYRMLFNKIGAPSFVIETDASNNYVASSYAWANARDWAKFGQLFLNEGVIDSLQILPSDWTSFTAQEAKGSNGKYGAQFWLPTPTDYPKSPRDMYFADGFQGQRIFIIPSEELVIVRLGLTRFEQPDYDSFIMDVINAL